MIFWGVGLLMLWIRPRIEIFWKIIATVVGVFYLWFFFDEIQNGFNSFAAGWYLFTIKFLREVITLVFINLFFLWPLCLIIIFYKADDIAAERLLKFICILTLVLWIIFVIYSFYSRGVDAFFYENVKQMVPNAK